MLKTTELIGFGARAAMIAAAPVTAINFLAGGGDLTENVSTHTVTLDLGTAVAGSKIVVLAAHANWTGSNVAITTMDFDGTTSLVDTGVSESSSGHGFVEGWYYDDTGGIIGGSTDINTDTTSKQQMHTIVAYRLTGAVTGGPTTSDTTTGATTHTFSLNTTTNSLLLGISSQRSNTDYSATWSGVTSLAKDFENVISGDYNNTTAGILVASGETPAAPVCTWSSAGIRGRALMMTWDEA